MPATIKWIEKLDSSLNDNEIILRDTDHTYDSLRFEYTNYDSSNYQELDGLISKYVSLFLRLCFPAFPNLFSKGIINCLNMSRNTTL